MSKRQNAVLVLMSLMCLSLVVQFSPAAADSPREILRLGRGTANALDWRPDKQIGAKAVLGGVQLYDADYHETVLLTVPELNGGQLLSLNWSPDGQFLAVGTVVTVPDQESTYQIYVWAISTDGKSAQQRFTLADKAYYVSWKPDSTQVAVHGRVYDVQTGKLVWTHQYGMIEYDMQTGESTRGERNRASGSGIYWSPDGQRFVSIEYGVAQSSNSTYAIFGDSTDELVVSLTDSDTDPSLPDFAWSEDGSKIVDNDGRSWDAQTGSFLASFSDDEMYGSFLGNTQSVWNRDNRTVFTVSSWMGKIQREPSFIFFWDSITGEIISRQGSWRMITSLGWQGDFLAAYSDDGYELTLNTISGNIQSAKRTSDALFVNNLAWNADSTKLVGIAPGPPHPPMQLWDVAAILSGAENNATWTGYDDWFIYEAEAAQYPPQSAKVRWHNDEIVTISQNPYIGRTFHSVERWNSDDGASLGRLYFSEAEMLPPTAEPSPDLRWLAQTNTYWLTQDSDKPHPIEILSSDTLQTHFSFESTNADILTWSPNGQQLAAVRLDKAMTQIWNIGQESVQLLATLNTASDDGAEWSPDGSMIAIGRQIYDSATGQLVSQLDFESPYRYWIEWSSDSRMIALYVYGQPQIRFYDVRTGKLIQAEAVPSQYVTAIAWSPDGTMLAVGMDDGTIRIWNVSDLQ